MKRFVLAASVLAAASAANAADMPAKAPVYKAPLISAYDWTGFYLGVNAGIGASQTTASTPSDPFTGSSALDRAGAGFTGGVQGGFNWQFAPHWVAGIEGDIGYLGVNRSSLDWNDAVAVGIKTDWYGTLRGRFGYANGSTLFYATGGGAFVAVRNNFDDLSSSSNASKSEIATGWTAGGGIETALGGNWSAKTEYLYIDAGRQDFSNTITGFANIATAHFDNRFHIFRYGLNYKFGGPAVAKALPTHDWSGFYVGVNAGVGLLQGKASAPVNPANSAADIAGTSLDLAEAGFSGGLQAGYNWQFAANWVAGFEGDIQYLRIKRTPANWDDPTIFFGAKTNWFSTLRGRLGYSTGPALLYVTGGAAFVKVTNNFDLVDPDPFAATANSQASASKIATGWTLGGGIEAALTQNWTAKTEYLYVDAGHQDVFNPDIGFGPATAHFGNRFHVFRYGLNYKFSSH